MVPHITDKCWNKEYDLLVTGVSSYNTSETVCDVIMYMYHSKWDIQLPKFFPMRWAPLVLEPHLPESWLCLCNINRFLGCQLPWPDTGFDLHSHCHFSHLHFLSISPQVSVSLKVCVSHPHCPQFLILCKVCLFRCVCTMQRVCTVCRTAHSPFSLEGHGCI